MAASPERKERRAKMKHIDELRSQLVGLGFRGDVALFAAVATVLGFSAAYALYG